MVPLGKPAKADHAIGIQIFSPIRVNRVGAGPVQIQLVAEDDKVSEAGANDVVEWGEEVMIAIGFEAQAKGVQDSKEEGVQITYAPADEHDH